MADDRTLPDTAVAGVPTALLVAGGGRLSTHAITGDAIVIGRATDCEVSIPHASLSRHHARVRRSPLTVQDLGSTNGTRVARDIHKGGEPVALAVGEAFHIGPFSFVVLDDRRAAETTGAAAKDALRVDDPTPAGVPAVVRAVAATDANVLVLGETGVGKELLAETVHALSKRPGELVRINCAAIAESLLESELFGHDKGAFTGAMRDKPGLLEVAHRGTAFLDEIGELPASLQAKLLRAVESGEITRVGAVRSHTVDVRFIAATHRDLAAEVAAKRFREDLFYRLDGISLRIAPLRERAHMIGGLALRFVEEIRPGAVMTPAFLARLAAHDWPGNVRELKQTIARAVMLADGDDLSPAHLVLSRRVAPESGTPPPPDPDSSERARIIEALAACAGNQTRAAKQLGISRATLSTKLALYNIPRPRK